MERNGFNHLHWRGLKANHYIAAMDGPRSGRSFVLPRFQQARGGPGIGTALQRGTIMKNGTARRLRSQEWFDNPDDPGMTALYIERYLNYGLTREELQSGKPIIGIAQTGSDLSPCNRHHIELARRIREGIREAGGIAMEFPVHPIQESGERPGAALDSNPAYMG